MFIGLFPLPWRRVLNQSRNRTRRTSRFAPLFEEPCLVLITFKNYVPGLPVVAFRFSETFRTQNPDVNQKWIQTLLRAKGWIVPNYELAPDLSTVDILRVVVRETVSEVLIERLLADIVGSQDTACASTTHVQVCRWRSRSLWPRPTLLPTLSTFSLKRTPRATRLATERLTRILEARVLEPTPSNVNKWK